MEYIFPPSGTWTEMGPELVSISIGAPRISLIGGTRIGTPLGGGLEQQPPMAMALAKCSYG